VVANSTAFVTRSTEILIITKSTVTAFASHQVGSLQTSICERLVLISHKDVLIVTEVAV